MNTVVSDDLAIINVMGVRHVTWGESTSAYGLRDAGRPFFVMVTWKGTHNTFYYKTEADAQNMFRKLRDTMDKTRKSE